MCEKMHSLLSTELCSRFAVQRTLVALRYSSIKLISYTCLMCEHPSPGPYNLQGRHCLFLSKCCPVAFLRPRRGHSEAAQKTICNYCRQLCEEVISPPLSEAGRFKISAASLVAVITALHIKMSP